MLLKCKQNRLKSSTVVMDRTAYDTKVTDVSEPATYNSNHRPHSLIFSLFYNECHTICDNLDYMLLLQARLLHCFHFFSNYIIGVMNYNVTESQDTPVWHVILYCIHEEVYGQ